MNTPRTDKSRTDTKKSRPILFSAPMVRALIDGTKTQTRRIVKLNDADHIVGRGDRKQWHPEDKNAWQGNPYGQPGDTLWVRETFAPAHLWRSEPKFAATTVDYLYAADYPRDPRRIVAPHHWKPSISCVRAASRITLEITAVRVERLNDIDGVDAMAEGIETLSGLPTINAVTDFAALWESINGPGSWDKNPWVWVIEFVPSHFTL